MTTGYCDLDCKKRFHVCNEHNEIPDCGPPWSCAQFGLSGHDYNDCNLCTTLFESHMFANGYAGQYARYEKSERLQRLLEFLVDGARRSTLEIIRGADICAVNSAVCELRENGFDVHCTQSRPAYYRLINPVSAQKLAARLLERNAA